MKSRIAAPNRRDVMRLLDHRKSARHKMVLGIITALSASSLLLQVEEAPVQARRIAATLVSATLVASVVLAIWIALLRDTKAPDVPDSVPFPRSEVRASPAESYSPLPTTRELVPLPDSSVEISIRDAGGRPLHGTVRGSAASLQIAGRGRAPANFGEAIVTSIGYKQATIHVYEEDLVVELVRLPVVRGQVVDAVTKAPIQMRLELRRGESSDVQSVCESTVSGGFAFEQMETGAYAIHGSVDGYLNVCDGLDAVADGIRISIGESDLDVSIVLFPIYVAFYALSNATNLDDRVFSGLLVSHSEPCPGTEAPQYFANKMEMRLKESAKRAGIRYPFVRLRVMRAESRGAFLGVTAFIGAEKRDSYRVLLRPLGDALRDGAVEVLPIRGTWNTTEVEIECPAPLELSIAKVSASAIALRPGVTSLRLPHGAYSIRPSELRSLLSGNQWSKTLNVPHEQRISFPTSLEFATFEICKTDAWSEGILYVTSDSNRIALWPHGEFPRVYYASPGSYTFSLTSSSPGKTAWSRKIAVVNRDRIKIDVGDK